MTNHTAKRMKEDDHKWLNMALERGRNVLNQRELMTTYTLELYANTKVKLKTHPMYAALMVTNDLDTMHTTKGLVENVRGILEHVTKEKTYSYPSAIWETNRMECSEIGFLDLLTIEKPLKDVEHSVELMLIALMDNGLYSIYDHQGESLISIQVND
jgi:hypothetical protein